MLGRIFYENDGSPAPVIPGSQPPPAEPPAPPPPTPPPTKEKRQGWSVDQWASAYYGLQGQYDLLKSEKTKAEEAVKSATKTYEGELATLRSQVNTLSSEKTTLQTQFQEASQKATLAEKRENVRRTITSLENPGDLMQRYDAGLIVGLETMEPEALKKYFTDLQAYESNRSEFLKKQNLSGSVPPPAPGSTPPPAEKTASELRDMIMGMQPGPERAKLQAQLTEALRKAQTQ